MRKPFRLYRKDEIVPTTIDLIPFPGFSSRFTLEPTFGLDVEAELTRLLSEQISEQINRDVIQNLIPLEHEPLPTGQLFYLDFIYTPNVAVEHIRIDFKINGGSITDRLPFKLKRKNERNKLKFRNDRS